jgi:3-methyl-2-oxobutanoate hydroxymethyltransferase
MSSDTVTTARLREMKAAGTKIVALTAWDFISGRIAQAAGADLVLVGDSLAMTVQGEDDTLGVTMDEMIYHTRLVARACRRPMVVADMPFMSYQISIKRAIENAGRFLKEGRARGVKVEGGKQVAEIIAKAAGAGIPVLGHIGLTPQSVHQLGGYKIQGAGLEAAARVIDDALAVEAAGAFAVVLECVPSALAARITDLLTIPTLGIGAGPECDGQIQVTADLLGLGGDKLPKHAGGYAKLNEAAETAVRSYAQEVREGAFPTTANSFAASPELEKAIESGEL